ncbi:MAG TPA: hydrolase TatD, partial [Thermoanaerobacterales bacterium]|nr:hydrolase TatD [Thermoanaerobacterales bacterium]
GKRNDPTRIPIIAQQLAQLRKISVDEIKRTTYSNLLHLAPKLLTFFK